MSSAAEAAELHERLGDGTHRGAVPRYRGQVPDGGFITGQDTSAYVPPAGARPLMHAEPFGPWTPSWWWTPRPSCWRR